MAAFMVVQWLWVWLITAGPVGVADAMFGTDRPPPPPCCRVPREVVAVAVVGVVGVGVGAVRGMGVVVAVTVAVVGAAG